MPKRIIRCRLRIASMLCIRHVLVNIYMVINRVCRMCNIRMCTRVRIRIMRL